MKKLSLILLVLLVATWIGLQINSDPGYALFSYGQWSVEMPLWLVALSMFVGLLILYYAMRVLHFFGALQGRLQHWQTRRRLRLAHQQIDRGLIELTEGRWQQAEHHLIDAVKDSNIPVVNYLAAARAAHEQSAYERRDDYLRAAHNATKKAAFAVSLTQAELQLGHQQFEQALATLNHLRELMPQHTYVLRLLQRLYFELKEWDNLAALLPALRKNKVFKQTEIDQLEKTTYDALLNNAAGHMQQLHAVWHKMPRALQQEPGLLTTYVKLLLALGEEDIVADLLQHALKKQWYEAWVYWFGIAKSSKPDQQLRLAETWLKQHPQDSTLLLTAGRLAERCQLWGKARGYWEASLGLAPRAETYRLLGDLLSDLNDAAAASACYKRGLQLLPQ